MIKLKLAVPLLLIALLATGCATLNKSECREADWRLIGFEDGAAGRQLDYVANHRKACAEYGVKPRLDSYRAGHAEGVSEYCTERNGFRQGRAGRDYGGVCPARSEDRFLAAYHTGLELHQLENELNGLRRDADQRQSELELMQQRSANLEQLLVSGALSANQRRVQLDEFKDLQNDMASHKSHIVDIERQILRLEREYDYLDSRHSF